MRGGGSQFVVLVGLEHGDCASEEVWEPHCGVATDLRMAE